MFQLMVNSIHTVLSSAISEWICSCNTTARQKCSPSRHTIFGAMLVHRLLLLAVDTQHTFSRKKKKLLTICEQVRESRIKFRGTRDGWAPLWFANALDQFRQKKTLRIISNDLFCLQKAHVFNTVRVLSNLYHDRFGPHRDDPARCPTTLT